MFSKFRRLFRWTSYIIVGETPRRACNSRYHQVTQPATCVLFHRTKPNFSTIFTCFRSFVDFSGESRTFSSAIFRLPREVIATIVLLLTSPKKRDVPTVLTWRVLKVPRTSRANLVHFRRLSSIFCVRWSFKSYNVTRYLLFYRSRENLQRIWSGFESLVDLPPTPRIFSRVKFHPLRAVSI